MTRTFVWSLLSHCDSSQLAIFHCFLWKSDKCFHRKFCSWKASALCTWSNSLFHAKESWASAPMWTFFLKSEIFLVDDSRLLKVNIATLFQDWCILFILLTLKFQLGNLWKSFVFWWFSKLSFFIRKCSNYLCLLLD